MMTLESAKYKLSLCLLACGIAADMITTFVGQILGFEEANPLGFVGVYIMNLFLIGCIVLAYRFHPPKFLLPYASILMVIMALFRFGVAGYNIGLMILY
jgi:hypothetical protein